MGEKTPEERQLVKIEEMSLEETQLAEQLYNNAGLDPVVDAGLKDYDKRLELESKLISKVLGPRGTDIKGYGEAVAKRVASAIYALLNKQYGGKVGDLRSYIMALEEERDRANTRYDDLMGRVIGVLGEEYKELRTDSKVFIEKLTTTLGEDLKESKIDQQALAERLADIDGLRLRIRTLDTEKEQLKERHESQITALKNEHSEKVGDLKSQIAELKNEHKEEVGNLKSQVDTLVKEEEQLRERHESQITVLKNERKEEVGNLKSQVDTLVKEKEQLKERHELQITVLKNEHKEEVGNLKSQVDTLVKEKEQLKERHESQIAELDSRIKGLESEKTTLTSDLSQLREDYNQLKTAVTTIAGAIPQEEIGEKLGEELYTFLLKDSKVPDMVIDGVGKFIDFRKYLRLAAVKGVKEATKQAEETLRNALRE